MYKNLLDLKKKFIEIKELGWIKSNKKGYGNIGNTFEELMGINKNEFEIPDYKGIEIKTKRGYSKRNITLFSAVPDGPHYHETERIKDLYGYPDTKLKEYNVLNTSVSAKENVKVGWYYYFKLKINRQSKKIFLEITDENKNILENCIYWDFDTLETKLYRKLKYLAFIKALSKKEKEIEYFKYYKLTFYKLKDFNTFINLLEDGIIKINFKLSIFKKGNKKGKIHDHGVSFNISEHDLEKLYNVCEL